jgi:DNA-binding IclR family transcriptional regulator
VSALSAKGRDGMTGDVAAGTTTERGTTIQSVDRAVAVLKALAGKPHGCSVIDIAAETRLDRTTVHRLVRTLVASGLVESRGPTYRIGSGCLSLGAARLNTLCLREIALPYAVDLQQSVVKDRPAVVSISALATDEVVIVDRIWTAAVPLNIIMGIGWHFPVEMTVSGRAMLSTFDDAAIAAMIGVERSQRLAPRLRVIRKREGMEWGSGEFHAGVSTLACPLIGPAGTAAGALVVAGLGMDADLDETSELAQNLRRSATTVSRLLQTSR